MLGRYRNVGNRWELVHGARARELELENHETTPSTLITNTWPGITYFLRPKSNYRQVLFKQSWIDSTRRCELGFGRLRPQMACAYPYEKRQSCHGQSSWLM